MLTKIVGRPAKARSKPKGPFPALADTGSSETIIDSEHARAMGLVCDKATDEIPIGGQAIPVCYRDVALQIPDTDCLLEVYRVAIATKPTGLPTILGADFMQRTGAFLDLRRERHGIGCDVEGRDPDPELIVAARPIRFDDNPSNERRGRTHHAQLDREIAEALGSKASRRSRRSGR
jgi:hypothetical protein